MKLKRYLLSKYDKFCRTHRQLDDPERIITIHEKCENAVVVVCESFESKQSGGGGGSRSIGKLDVPFSTRLRCPDRILDFG